MWSDVFNAGNTIYNSQATHSKFILCEHVWLFVGEVYAAAPVASPITLVACINV